MSVFFLIPSACLAVGRTNLIREVYSQPPITRFKPNLSGRFVSTEVTHRDTSARWDHVIFMEYVRRDGHSSFIL